MAIKDLFQNKKQKKKYATIRVYRDDNNEFKSEKNEEKIQPITIDENIWTKCKNCGEIFLIKDYENNSKICLYCGSYGRLDSRKRLENIIDEGTFEEYDQKLSSLNPLNFPSYENKIKDSQENTGLKDAIVTGRGNINGQPCGVGVMDSRFMMGSMGSVVGEKIARLIEKSIEKKEGVVIFSASGGARMQEGMLSLMQMAKTSAVLAKLDEEKLPFISVLTDPTTGGVTASFAMLGDIIIAEPNTLIAFAGPRVIEQITKQKLPEGFQKAEFLLEKGFIDKIVDRTEMKHVIGDLLKLHSMGGERVE